MWVLRNIKVFTVSTYVSQMCIGLCCYFLLPVGSIIFFLILSALRGHFPATRPTVHLSSVCCLLPTSDDGGVVYKFYNPGVGLGGYILIGEEGVQHMTLGSIQSKKLLFGVSDLLSCSLSCLGFRWISIICDIKRK